MDRKLEILRRLAQAGDYVSGQELCEQLHVSRTAVWKSIQKLKEEGYPIEAVTNKGYRLLSTNKPDILSEEQISAGLTTAWAGRPLLYKEETGSTNDDAFILAAKGYPHGTLIVASRQTAGKGRRGRTWISPEDGNVYMSILLKPDLRPDVTPMLTVVMALSVYQASAELAEQAASGQTAPAGCSPVSPDQADRASVSREPSGRSAASQDPAVQATTSQDPAVQATASRDSADRSAASQDPAVQATTSQDPAVQATASRDSADRSAASQDPAVQVTTSRDPAVQATTSQDFAGQFAASQDSAVRPASCRFGIKWPNDIVVSVDGGPYRKLCGILTEMRMEDSEISAIAIGIGLNINQTDFAPEIAENATSYRLATGQKMNRAALTASVWNHFEQNYILFTQTQDFSRLRPAYEKGLVNLGRPVHVLDPRAPYTGTAVGINAQGELLVKPDDGSSVRIVGSGEVSVRGVQGYV